MKKKWTLVWEDEFDEEKINTEKWGYEIGYIRNNELQYYTDNNNNAYIKDSNLVIEARKENYCNFQYTSASLNTKGKAEFTYGKIEMRAKLPFGKGIWPAFWTLGSDFFEDSDWPQCGEIDVMELIGGSSPVDGVLGDGRIYATLHHADSQGEHTMQGFEVSLTGGSFADEYHVFGIEWDEAKIKWLLDDKEYFSVDLNGKEKDAFRRPHFLLLNLAVGGDWPGSPDDSTIFPQKYLIDWVRVYKSEI